LLAAAVGEGWCVLAPQGQVQVQTAADTGLGRGHEHGGHAVPAGDLGGDVPKDGVVIYGGEGVTVGEGHFALAGRSLGLEGFVPDRCVGQRRAQVVEEVTDLGGMLQGV
jgi:hypothetical protein